MTVWRLSMSAALRSSPGGSPGWSVRKALARPPVQHGPGRAGADFRADPAGGAGHYGSAAASLYHWGVLRTFLIPREFAGEKNLMAAAHDLRIDPPTAAAESFAGALPNASSRAEQAWVLRGRKRALLAYDAGTATGGSCGKRAGLEKRSRLEKGRDTGER